MENGNQPVTKSELGQALQDLETRLESRFAGRMDTLEQRLTDRIVEAVRDSETRLLQAFYGYAEATNRRFVQIEASDTIMLSRFATLEGRVLELEKRLNMPPQG
jgi:hypothetical protein